MVVEVEYVWVAKDVRSRWCKFTIATALRKERSGE